MSIIDRATRRQTAGHISGATKPNRAHRWRRLWAQASGIPLALLFTSTAMAQQTPPAATETVVVTPEARALHNSILTLDTHLDTPANFVRPDWDFADAHSLESDFAQVDLPRMREGGLTGGFFAIYTPQGPRTPEAIRAARDIALLRASAIRETVARNHTAAALATTADDAARIKASNRIIVYQSIENAYPLSGDITLLRTFYDFGVRMVGVAHFRNNDFGDSSTDPAGPEWQGLSPLGRDLVREANRLGIILDGSHSSDLVLDQLIALSATPVILSHSGVKAVYDHPRNIDDTRLRALAASGGVIQINAYGDYVAAPAQENPERSAALRALYSQVGDLRRLNATQVADLVRQRRAIDARFPGSERRFDQFLAHLLHALQVAGVDHVGIGLDWDGGGGVADLRDVTDIPRITQALISAGYSRTDIEKIWSGNVLRLLRAAETYAQTAQQPATTAPAPAH